MSGQRLILLAEDSRDDAFLLRRAFMAAGVSCAIIDVRNGQQAINYLNGDPLYADRATFPIPHLVILDLKMPLVDGFEVLKWLKTQPTLKSVPVVVLSSSNLETDREKARTLGAQDYLVKPNDPKELVKVAQKLQERWLDAKNASAS